MPRSGACAARRDTAPIQAVLSASRDYRSLCRITLSPWEQSRSASPQKRQERRPGGAPLSAHGPKTESGWSVLRGNRHDAELTEQLDHVKVEAGLDLEVILVPGDRDGAAGDFALGRLDGAHRAGQRRRMRALEDEFLDDPGTADELVRDVDPRVRERLEPAVRVAENRLFAFQADIAGGRERGVRSNQGP